MSFGNYGISSKAKHDYPTPRTGTDEPRYMILFGEDEDNPDGSPVAEDPILGFRSSTNPSDNNAKVYLGILSGGLPTPEHNITVSNLSAGLVVETDRITVKPGIIFNGISGSNPSAEVEGHTFYDLDDHKLKFWNGTGWMTLDTASGSEVSGSGTTGKLTKWTDGSGSVIGDSLIS
jgi:hypothetical protein